MLPKRFLVPASLEFLIAFVILSMSQVSYCAANYTRNCSEVPVILYESKNSIQSLRKDVGYEELLVEGTYDVEFSCWSKSPIKFGFQGPLPNQQVSSKSFRHTGSSNWDKAENFCYQTSIKVKPIIGATGTYECSNVEKDVNKTSIYLYFNANDPQKILGAGYTIPVNVSTEDTTVVIPCRVKHPNISTTLTKDKVLLDLINVEKYYDPKIGYTFPITNITELLGHYKCQANTSEQWDYISANVTLADDAVIDRTNETVPRIIIKDGLEQYKNDTKFICSAPGAGGVHCFRYVPCFTPTECDILTECFSKTGHAECTTEGVDCPIPYLSNSNLEKKEDCRMLSKEKIGSAGLIRCNTNQHVERTIRFFTDLNGKIVFDDTEVPLADTLQIAKLPYDWEDVDELWTEEWINLTCRASKFRFAKGFRWMFILNDVHVVENVESKKLPSVEMNENYYSETFSVKISNVNITKIFCTAPELNSNEWAKVSIKVKKIRASQMPVFTKPENEDIHFKSTKKSLDLKCEASGLPLAKITWYKYPDVEIDKSVSIWTNGSTIGNLLTIKPADIDESGSGSTTFICNATNVRGSIFKNVTVILDQRTDYRPQWPHYVTAIIVVFAVLLFILMVLYIRAAKKNNKYVRLLKFDEENFFQGAKPSVDMDAGTQTDLPQYAMEPYAKAYEVPLSNLILGERLDAGQFGVVYRGRLKDPVGEKEVAYKTMKDPPDYDAFLLLLEEIKILQHVGHHPNVIRYLGAVTKDIRKLRAYVITEYCIFGNLKKYLNDHRGSFQNEISDRGSCLVATNKSPYSAFIMDNVTWTVNSTTTNEARIGNYVQFEYAMKSGDLIQWSLEIAAGMEYLTNKKLIHRDLAARNIVLNSDRVAKITDFGLSKYLPANTGRNEGKDYYVINPGKPHLLALPWLAPEVLVTGKCSVSTDVWAYGVTLWEIFTLGESPFPEKKMDEVQKFIEDNVRLSKPPFADRSIYKIMNDCWNVVPKERPSFSVLRDRFASLQTGSKDADTASALQSEEECEEEIEEEEGNVDSDNMEE